MVKTYEKPTVLDVAQAAGVAVGTVSRVLNDPENVRGPLRQRVLEAIKRLDYQPLRRRRGGRYRWVRKGTGNLGIVFLGIPSLSHVPVLSEAMQGVEAEVAASDGNLMMANLPTADEIPVFLRKNMVDGLIVRSALVGDFRKLTHPGLLAAIDRLPHVWLVGRPAAGGGDVVECDLDAVGRIAADYLGSWGHRTAVTMDAKPTQQGVMSPLETFACHARQLGIRVESVTGPVSEVPERWPAEPIAERHAMAFMVERWLAMPAGIRPGVIVLGTDVAAVSLYSVLRERGMEVGRDVSVISLRMEQQFANGLDPVTCTIDNGAETIGRLAVRQLRWRFQHPEDTAGIRIRVGPRLIEGASVVTVA